jgi:hypothetical protein
MPVPAPVSASSYGVPQNQVVSKPIISSNSLNITKATATQGGKKRKQYGGITVQGNATSSTYSQVNAVSNTQTSNSLQQAGVQAKINASNDNGAYSPLYNSPGMIANNPNVTGGRRRKTRKTRKSRKSRKSRKHKRRNTHKK